MNALNAMAPAKTTARKRRVTSGEGRRAQLLGDVEALWCALSSAVALFQTRAAAQRGLTLTDLQAVDVLSREGSVCAGDLAEICGLTPGAITGMLNRLERAGVARRERDQADSRRFIIRPVEAQPGRECRVPPSFRKVAGAFDETQLHAIRQFLSESVRALQRDAENIRDD